MTRMRRGRVVVLAVVLLAGAACGGDDDDDAAGDDTTTTTAAADSTTTTEATEATDGGEAGGRIVIEGFAFSGLEVVAGEPATVTNNDNSTHTFTSDDGAFDSGEVGAGDTVDLEVPDEPGEYAVHCEIHSTMKGVLTVT